MFRGVVRPCPWKSASAVHIPEEGLSMSRRLLLPALLLVLLVAAWAARAEEEPVFRGKKVSEWVVQLKEGKTVNRRRVALLALEYIGPKRSRKVFPAMVGALRG